MQCIKKFTYAELTGSLLLYRAKSVLYFIIYFIICFHLRPGKIKNREQYLPVFMPMFYKAAIVSRFITAQQNLFYNYNRYFGIVYNMVAYTAKQQFLNAGKASGAHNNHTGTGFFSCA